VRGSNWCRSGDLGEIEGELRGKSGARAGDKSDCRGCRKFHSEGERERGSVRGKRSIYLALYRVSKSRKNGGVNKGRGGKEGANQKVQKKPHWWRWVSGRRTKYAL